MRRDFLLFMVGQPGEEGFVTKRESFAYVVLCQKRYEPLVIWRIREGCMSCVSNNQVGVSSGKDEWVCRRSLPWSFGPL